MMRPESSRPALQPPISLSSAETLDQGNWKNCSHNTRRVAQSQIQRCMFKSEPFCKYPSPLFYPHTPLPCDNLPQSELKGGWHRNCLPRCIILNLISILTSSLPSFSWLKWTPSFVLNET